MNRLSMQNHKSDISPNTLCNGDNSKVDGVKSRNNKYQTHANGDEKRKMDADEGTQDGKDNTTQGTYHNQRTQGTLQGHGSYGRPFELSGTSKIPEKVAGRGYQFSLPSQDFHFAEVATPIP